MGRGAHHALDVLGVSPSAQALLSQAAERGLCADDITDANREDLRELYHLGLIDFYEPLPGLWKPTLSGRRIAGD